jgi:CPA1 family monovalent cation:H+ antiporter
MDLYTAFSLALLLIAVVAYGNHHTLRLPNTIAVMMAGCILAIMLIVLGKLHVVSINDAVTQQIRQLNFHGLLVNGILSFLLFAGALSIDSKQLRDHQWEVGTLALLNGRWGFLLPSAMVWFKNDFLRVLAVWRLNFTNRSDCCIGHIQAAECTKKYSRHCGWRIIVQ